MAIDGALALLDRLTEIKVPKKLFLAVTGIGIFIAGYLAWLDEYAAHQASIQTIADGNVKIARLEAQLETKSEGTLTKELEATKTQLQSMTQQLEETRSQLAKVQEKSTPRRLNQEQKDHMAKLLSSFEPYTIENIIVPIGDTEAFTFALDIKNVLEKAGWKVESYGHGILDRPLKGIVVRVSDKGSVPMGANVLRQALTENKIEHEGAKYSQQKQDTFSLAIGSKE